MRSISGERIERRRCECFLTDRIFTNRLLHLRVCSTTQVSVVDNSVWGWRGREVKCFSLQGSPMSSQPETPTAQGKEGVMAREKGERLAKYEKVHHGLPRTHS